MIFLRDFISKLIPTTGMHFTVRFEGTDFVGNKTIQNYNKFGENVFCNIFSIVLNLLQLFLYCFRCSFFKEYYSFSHIIPLQNYNISPN